LLLVVPATCIGSSDSIIFPIVTLGTLGARVSYGANTQSLNRVPKAAMFLVEKHCPLRCGIEISKIKKRGINYLFLFQDYSEKFRSTSISDVEI
ncbi:MAG: hypothetical protein WBE34_16015, partial [Candidatus Nitrosopolaris sp.]